MLKINNKLLILVLVSAKLTTTNFQTSNFSYLRIRKRNDFRFHIFTLFQEFLSVLISTTVH